MAVSSLEAWNRFDRQVVSLADVVGTPGLPPAPELADAVSGALGGDWRQVAPASEAPFLIGEFSRQLLGSNLAKVASFLGELNSALPEANLQGEDVSVLRSFDSASGSHVVAQQTIRGAEVLGARFRVHMQDNRPYCFSGRPVGDLRPMDPGEPPATLELAAAQALRTLFDLPQEVPIGVKRMIFPVEGRGIWAFQGSFVLYDPPSDVRAYVRADDLSLMLSFNTASAFYRGEGQVHRINPLRTPGLEAVRLDNIGPVPPDMLSGGVVDVKPRLGAPVSQQLRDFRGGANGAGFDEVQTYYHLSQALRYYGSLFDSTFLGAAPFAPVRAIVRDPQSPNNAYFLPATGELRFGDFAGRPSARSAEIIYHELGHAVSDSTCRLGRGPRNSEARGLSEGYSDYFAASALGSPVIADYLTNQGPQTRDCSRQDLSFPTAFPSDEHRTGEVWAAVLWGIRSACGAGVADILAAESLQFLDPQSSLQQARTALITADQRLFPAPAGSGRHEDTIKAEFDAR